jgi:hypothetical protein
MKMTELSKLYLAECFEKAAKLFESGRAKWGQNNFKRSMGHYDENGHWVPDPQYPEGEFCMMGAVNHVCPATKNRREEVAGALGFMGTKRQPDEAVLYNWNDRKIQTVKPVITRLRKYAAKMREEAAAEGETEATAPPNCA